MYSHSLGMQYSVVCSDMVPFERYDDVAVAAQGVMPEIRAAFPGVRYRFGICDLWPHGSVDPREHRAVTSDVPTLVLESVNDPVTPPAYGQEAAKTLSRSVYVETPGVGHSVVSNEGGCAQGLLRAFYADPLQRPSTTCTAGLGVLFITGI
jgi:pimeloyl-ACP methyl ester carboxylesterase